jgi:hypothetical protein
MSELFATDSMGPYLLPLLLVVLLLVFLLVYRRRSGSARSVEKVVKSIAYEYLSNLIIPNADGGEIQIDHLILTAEGLLVIDVKEVNGTVFGSDKMQDWTVIASERRFTFSNPQPAMFDRIAAVRQIVRQVPVTGRILFLDGAEFSKGVPGLVCQLDDLLAEYGEKDKLSAKSKIEAFKPHWDQILAQSKTAEPGR